MSRQTNIVSFDDARRARSSRGAAAGTSVSRVSRMPASVASSRVSHTSASSTSSRGDDYARFADRASSNSLGASCTPSRMPRSSSRVGQNSGTLFADEEFYASLNFGDDFVAEKPVFAGRMGDSFIGRPRGGVSGENVSRSHYEYGTSRSSAASSRIVEVYEEEEPIDEVRGEASRKKGPFAGLREKASKAKRSKTKEKAGKKFASQYGGDTSSDASAGPRAAVYKGEMGSNHKRAARLQDEGHSASSAAGKRSSRGVSAVASSPKFIVACGVTVCVALSCAFLYQPAQQYYQELRERDRLAVEYAAIQERNDNLEQSVAYLSTDEGVEDQARQEFGWVKDDEHAVSVSGVTVEEESNFTANILSSDIEPPDTWYSDILDPLFGVE